MKPKQVNPFEGIGNFLEARLNGVKPRKIVRTKLGDITIDTCISSDFCLPETGIRRESIEGKWIVVEQYETIDTANIGHDKWVALIKQSPTIPLHDIDLWNLHAYKSN